MTESESESESASASASVPMKVEHYPSVLKTFYKMILTKMITHNRFSKLLASIFAIVLLISLSQYASADSTSLDNANIDLFKAIKKDDPDLTLAAIKAGASLKDRDYDRFNIFAGPISTAILLGSKRSLQMLASHADDLTSGYATAVILSDEVSFELLVAIQPPSQEFLDEALSIFAIRFSPEARKYFREERTAEIDGEHMTASFDAFPMLGFLSKPDASELSLPRRLMELGASLSFDSKGLSGPLKEAGDSGDVFFADWLAAQHIEKPDTSYWVHLAINAALIGNLAGIESLISRNVDVNTCGKKGRTALLNAIRGGNKKIVQLLIDNKVDINAPSQGNSPTCTKFEHAPLTEAVSLGRIEIAETLIDSGAKLNDIDANGTTWPLREAVRNGLVELAQLLLKAGAEPNLKDAQQRTLLHEYRPQVIYSVSNSDNLPRMRPVHLKCIELLGAAGLNFNSIDGNGLSILGSALESNNAGYDFLNALVAQGAKPDLSTYKSLFISGATEKATEEKISWFFKYAGGDANYRLSDAGNRSLFEVAVSARKYSLMNELLLAGASLPESLDQRAIALRFAVEGDPGLVALLLQQGISADTKVLDRTSVLEYALRAAPELVRVLLDAGANVNIPGTNGGSVVHALIRDANVSNYPEDFFLPEQSAALVLLIDRGLDLKKQDIHGETIFDLARKSKTMTKNISDIVAKATGLEILKLHDAVRSDNLAKLQELVESGLDINRKDSMGRSALSLALALGNSEAVSLLLRKNPIISGVPQIRGMPSDYDYAADPRFASMLLPRLLSDWAISYTSQPKNDIEKIVTSNNANSIQSFKWIIRNRKGAATPSSRPMSGNMEGPFPFPPMESTRIDLERKVWFRFVVFPHGPQQVSGTGLGDEIVRSIYTETVFTAEGTGVIPGCVFSFEESPYCYPRVNIRVDEDSSGKVSVAQGALKRDLSKGQSVTFDRSLGDIQVRIPPVEGKEFSISFHIIYPDGPVIRFENGITLTGITNAYITLSKWRAKRLNALEWANANSDDAEEYRAAMIEAKSLATDERLLSAQMIQGGAHAVALTNFKKAAENMTDQSLRLTDLRKLLLVQLEFSAQDLGVLILKAQQNAADEPASAEKWREIVSDLKTAEAAAVATNINVETFRLGFLASLDKVIMDYQTAALELAQYYPPDILQNEIHFDDYKRKEIQRRFTDRDKTVNKQLLPDQAFGGQGQKLRRILALP